MSLKEGYWRKSNRTDLIEPCVNNPSNCKGGHNNFTCLKGHHGALCEACDLYAEHWETAYANSDDFDCGSCKETSGLNSAVMVIITIVSLVIVGFSVKSSYEDITIVINNFYKYKNISYSFFLY